MRSMVRAMALGGGDCGGPRGRAGRRRGSRRGSARSSTSRSPRASIDLAPLRRGGHRLRQRRAARARPAAAEARRAAAARGGGARAQHGAVADPQPPPADRRRGPAGAAHGPQRRALPHRRREHRDGEGAAAARAADRDEGATAAPSPTPTPAGRCRCTPTPRLAQSAVARWMASPKHRASLLSTTFRRIGTSAALDPQGTGLRRRVSGAELRRLSRARSVGGDAGRLAVEDVVADRRGAGELARPVGADVGRVEMRGARR